MSLEQSYQKTVDYLYGLQKQGIKLSLTTTLKLMEMLGGPHRKFPTVHVAGTNGKGSTAAFIAGMLQAAGYRAGLYSSPHLIDFTERIRINNVPIPEAVVVQLAQRLRDGCRMAAGDESETLNPTFFEVTTALAFAYFAEEGIDIGVIETGMGGRLDSTNVITPLVTVITNIDLEHQEFLGNTLKMIAREKAGIIKKGVPVITGAVHPEAISVIEREAAVHDAPVYRLGLDFMPKNIIQGRNQIFDYHGITGSIPAVRIGMLGAHQVENACLATAAVECLKNVNIAVGEPALRQGLEQTHWEGRMELVSSRPDIFLDGAHNPASAKKLAETLRHIKTDYRRVILVIGILKDKDHSGILSELIPVVDHVVATKPQYSRAMDDHMLAAAIATQHASVDSAHTVEKAVEKARLAASPDDLVLVAGSLYVVGEARALFKTSFPGTKLTGALSGLKG